MPACSVFEISNAACSLAFFEGTYTVVTRGAPFTVEQVTPVQFEVQGFPAAQLDRN